MNAPPFLPNFRPLLEALFAGSRGPETSAHSLTQSLFTSQPHRWSEGDWAIYRKSKRSTHPGQRACEVKANQKGETYAYVVEKFWVVDRVLSDGTLVMKTTRGKEHRIRPDDRNLVRPTLWTRLRWANRFRSISVAHPENAAAA